MKTLKNLFASNEIFNTNQKIALLLFIPIAILLIINSFLTDLPFVL